MATYQPKAYKQFNRSTGQWITITPKPTDFNEKKPRYVREYVPAGVKANNHSQVILNVFKSNPDRAFSWFEVLEKINHSINTNSIKEWISRLKRMGLLIKTKDTIKNTKNQECIRYKLKTNEKTI